MNLTDLESLIKTRLLSYKEAEHKIGLLNTLYLMMQEDIVHFYYEKNSGEHRSAYGTLNPSLISRFDGLPDGKKTAPTFTFNYFDIERRNWRSFRPENIYDIDKQYVI